jgi:hypothetical protein
LFCLHLGLRLFVAEAQRFRGIARRFDLTGPLTPGRSSTVDAN